MYLYQKSLSLFPVPTFLNDQSALLYLDYTHTHFATIHFHLPWVFEKRD